MNIIKGIIIGIAKVIPGLSGTVLMISFNLYDKAINAITCFFDSPKRNFIFLFKLFIGVMIGVVFFSRLVSYFMTNYYLYTIALFIGLILGGIVVVKKEVVSSIGNYLLMLFAFVLMLWLSSSNLASVYVLRNNLIDSLVFFIAGVLEAIGTILPGVSSTALLMIIGVYPYYLEVLGNLFNVSFMFSSISFLIPFGIGLVGGVIVISIIVNYLFRYYKASTFSLILGLSFSSVTFLFMGIIPYIKSISDVFLVILLVSVGYFMTRIIG